MPKPNERKTLTYTTPEDAEDLVETINTILSFIEAGYRIDSFQYSRNGGKRLTIEYVPSDWPRRG